MHNSFRPEYENNVDRVQLDTRVKFIVTVLIIAGIVITPNGTWIAYPLLWTLVSSVAAINRVSAWKIGRLAGLALPFTLAAVTLLVTTPGHPILRLAALTVTDAGLIRFMSIAFKSWLSVQTMLLFAMTTSFTELLWALESLRLPPALVGIISFMYRYLFTIKDEAEKLLRARAARSGTPNGSRSGGSLRWRTQIVGGMAGNLFLRSYERSERVYAAMLARGYHGDMMRRETQPLAWRDVWQGAIPIALMVIIQIAVRI